MPGITEALVSLAKAIKLGGHRDSDAETGALISEDHLNKVADYVDRARELGATGLEEYQEKKHVYQNIAPAVTGWFSG